MSYDEVCTANSGDNDGVFLSGTCEGPSPSFSSSVPSNYSMSVV